MEQAPDSGIERRPVNSFATVYMGKDEAGSNYRVMTLDGDVIKEAATVAGQGTIYVGNAYANEDVLVEKIAGPDTEAEAPA